MKPEATCGTAGKPPLLQPDASAWPQNPFADGDRAPRLSPASPTPVYLRASHHTLPPTQSKSTGSHLGRIFKKQKDSTLFLLQEHTYTPGPTPRPPPTYTHIITGNCNIKRKRSGRCRHHLITLESGVSPMLWLCWTGSD